MADLFVLFLTLTIFGVGVTAIDFLGVFDNADNDSGGNDNAQLKQCAETSADEPSAGIHGSNLVYENRKPGIRIISKVMNILRSAVYFSLGFGPTGLFASFSGLSKMPGLIWAFAAGAAMMILARLIKRLIKRDLDSSIKSNELLQEEGILLLPLEDGVISKASVRQYGREIEIYVRCRDKECKFHKGEKIIIEEYDNDVYWIKPAE